MVEGQQVARKGRVDAARGGSEGEGCRRRREELPAVCGHYSLFNNTSVSISGSASVYLASWPSPAHLHTYTRRTGFCPPTPRDTYALTLHLTATALRFQLGLTPRPDTPTRPPHAHASTLLLHYL